MSKSFFMAGLLLLCSVFSPVVAKETPACATDGWGVCKDYSQPVSYKACAFAMPFVAEGNVSSQSVAVIAVPHDTSVYDCIGLGMELETPAFGFKPVCLFPETVTEASIAEDKVAWKLSILKRVGQQTSAGPWWPMSTAFPASAAIPKENCGW